MKVMKFGGSSVADADRIRSVAGLVRESARAGRVVVVLSALQGITDLLVAAARAAEAGSDEFRTMLDTLRARHLEAVRGLFAPADQASVITPLTLMANELEEVLHGVELLRECTHRTMDLAMSFGERMSCAIFTAFLAAHGGKAQYIDASNGSLGLSAELLVQKISDRKLEQTTVRPTGVAILVGAGVGLILWALIWLVAPALRMKA